MDAGSGRVGSAASRSSRPRCWRPASAAGCPDVEVVFAGAPRGLEAKIVPQHGYRLELLDVEPMKGGGPARAVRGALVAAKAMRHARGLVRTMKPAAVLSVTMTGTGARA